MMQRKPGFPVANCSIKMPDGMSAAESQPSEEEAESAQRRQQLVNFGHKQWGFNNWSWSVTKQDLDFVDFTNGKFCAGVCAYVSVTVKTLDIHRENIGYATTLAPNKGSAIHKARKCAVTNALRETLLSFGGAVASELLDLTEAQKREVPTPAPPEPPQPESNQNNQNIPNKLPEPKNSSSHVKPQMRKDENVRHPGPPIKNVQSVQSVPNPPPPVAKAHPMPASLPPAANRPVLPANPPRPPPPPPHQPRPNSNDARDTRPLESMSEEEARAERKRRQQRAQEEFRLRMLKTNQGNDDNPSDMSRAASSFDAMLMDIPTQDIKIEQTGDEEQGKRKSPAPDGSAKRRSVMTRLDIVTD